jgi:ssDNA-binding Zn-finger/Zn-ribbon topoisomerase 1
MKFKLPYGLKDGNLVHISSVEKGLKCGCVCPACHHPLVARKGDKTVHHFAHHNGSECAKGIETALHLSAKEILERRRKIRLPKVEVKFNSYRDNWTISEEMEIEFNEVRLEYRMDSIVPDVIVYVKGRPLLIEITVTHQTNATKINKIKELGLSCLEIDLSNIKREISLEDLEEIVIEHVEHKGWLHNERSSIFKNKAISLTEKKRVIQRGFANHSMVFTVFNVNNDRTLLGEVGMIGSFA